MQGRPWYVFTGGPGAGKTTLLNEMARLGYHAVPEVARRLFEVELAEGKTVDEIRKAMNPFQHRILEEALLQEGLIPADTTTFLDRGIPDSIAYYRFFDIPRDRELDHALAHASYKKIFLLELVSIESDGVRAETKDEAVFLHHLIAQAYTENGYELTRVPVMTIEERRDFVLANL
ncbi:ATP-binding protein [Candidatus Kaiserbacteria bacterium]|nr:ATP-binding protein [Candidatus Kaiserbacteria bacterium]